MAQLKLLFLGPPRIELADEPVVLRRRKVLALLAYLAVTDAPHSRDELAELLYPGLDRDRAYADLRQSLSYLLDSIGQSRVEKSTGSVSFTTREELFHDVAEFRRLLKNDRADGRRGAGRGGGLEKAVRLYRGRFLAGFYLKDSPAWEQWQAGQEDGLRREYADAVDRLVAVCRSSGDVEAAVQWAHAAADIDPLEEASQRRLMAVLAADGRRTEALRQYDRCRALLAESLDAEPDAETEALRGRILANDAIVEARRPAPSRAPIEAIASVPPAAPPAAGETGAVFLVASDSRSVHSSPSVACTAALRRASPAGKKIVGRAVVHAVEPGGEDAGWQRASSLLRAAPPGHVLVSGPAARLAADSLPPGATLRPLGIRLLDDLGPALAIFRLAHPKLPARIPPIRTLEGLPGNLHPQPTPLVGRERLVETVVAALRGNGTRILTLTGPGGSGKTRLALHAAARLWRWFAHGAFFVDLSATRDAGEVAPLVAAIIGLRQSPGDSRPPLDALLDWLARRQMLLVLDNVEQIIAAGPSLGRIADECPGVSLIVTSRQPLHLLAEREVPVPPLEIEESGATEGGRAAPSAAVRLFTERARAADPAFALGTAGPSVIADICAAVDCLPLAIELAAPWVKVLPAPVLLERLASRLQVLDRGSRDLPERQRTLRSEIAWSHDLLEPEEQHLFRSLAVFPAGFPLDALETVAPGPRTLDLAASLVDKNLVLRIPAAGGVPRFRMLETIREYAVERLDESGQTEEVGRRFTAWAVRSAEAADADLRGPRHDVGFERLEADHETLVHALCLVLDRREAITGVRLAAGLGWFWFRRGRFSTGAQLLERSLGMGDDAADPGSRARALHALGWMRLMLGGSFSGNTEAGDCFRRALALAETSGEARLESLCRALLAWCEADLPPADRCAMADGAVTRARGAGDAWALSLCLKIAYSFFPRPDVAPAQVISALEEALGLARESGDPFLVCQALHGMGDVHRNLHDDEAAEPWYLEALEIADRIGDGWSSFDTRSHLAWGWLNRGDPTRARRCFAEALRAASGFGARAYVGQFLHGLAIVARQEGDVIRALRLGGAAASIRYPGRPRLDARLTGEADLPRASMEKEWSAGAAMDADEVLRYALAPP